MPKEYIEREVLLKAVEKMDRLDKETKLPYKYDKRGFLILINLAPTADVVEVTYCRDCQHWNNNIPYPDEFGCCQKHNLEITEKNDFCSYGERKGK